MSPRTTTAVQPRPTFPRPAALTAVATGGAVGTALRAWVITATAPAPGFPVTVLAINVVGALALGVIVEALPHHRRQLRLLLCTLLGIPLRDYRRRFPRVDSVALTELRYPADPAAMVGLISYNAPITGLA